MKKVPLKKIVVLVTFGMILFMSKGMAQVEKGVTSTGKEVDCTTINPSVDKTVNSVRECYAFSPNKGSCFTSLYNRYVVSNGIHAIYHVL